MNEPSCRSKLIHKNLSTTKKKTKNKNWQEYGVSKLGIKSVEGNQGKDEARMRARVPT